MARSAGGPASGRGGLRLAATSRVAAHADFFQEHFQRTEVGERRLKQVQADERGEPEPVRAVIVRQQQAGKNEGPGKPPDEHVHFHVFSFKFRLIPSHERPGSYKQSGPWAD